MPSIPKLPAWVKDTCKNIVFDVTACILHGAFGYFLFTAEEHGEIQNLKKLALLVIEKSPESTTEPAVCETIKKTKQLGLEAFAKQASPEAIDAGAVATAKVVCSKTFNPRFIKVLIVACLKSTTSNSSFKPVNFRLYFTLR